MVFQQWHGGSHGLGGLVGSAAWHRHHDGESPRLAEVPEFRPTQAIFPRAQIQSAQLLDEFHDQLGCAALLVLGIATRPAAAVLAFTMTIAAFVILADKDAAGKELALLYLTGAVALLFTGAGAYSFDARFSIVKKRMFR
jgi:uncharacterized membrane protein YphA (DoxX/SURF4 family)